MLQRARDISTFPTFVLQNSSGNEILLSLSIPDVGEKRSTFSFRPTPTPRKVLYSLVVDDSATCPIYTPWHDVYAAKVGDEFVQPVVSVSTRFADSTISFRAEDIPLHNVCTKKIMLTPHTSKYLLYFTCVLIYVQKCQSEVYSCSYFRDVGKCSMYIRKQ